MFSYEDRIRAVKLYFKYGGKTATVVRELGYPSGKNLRRWVETYQKLGDLPKRRLPTQRYTLEQKRTAVDHYFGHGCSLTVTRRALGYPGSQLLRCWIEELRPGSRRMVTSTNTSAPFAPDQKRQAVTDLCARQGSAQDVAKKVGVSLSMLYKWKDQLLGDEAYRSMRKRKLVSPGDEHAAQLERIAQLEQQVRQLQLERDILARAGDLIKKDQGINSLPLTNREKTQVVDALKATYSLSELLRVIGLARSSYFYHKTGLSLRDKYADVRTDVVDIFNSNHRCYGYRRIHAMLCQRDIRISEKIVRRLMVEEQLSVHRPLRRYSSYSGEIGTAPENLVARDFHSQAPNQKWLTDITEFQLPAGKVYLSPMIDCFDGKVVSWSIGTRPDAQLVNSMLDGAITTLTDGDRPVVHSDRGAHYRWPGWLQRINAAGLIRSMSRKGCSPDNAACEGFFGRLKNEMYYCRDWAGTTVDGFMHELNSYIHWYNERRIKLSLQAMSPVNYRRHLGIAT
ncbi:IS3 family transposase [Cupriavidus necator]|uniref:IS3 family transposase n=1 Tax=Cupriavidus necator TaxID=106590 RepID=UPI0039C31B78